MSALKATRLRNLSVESRNLAALPSDEYSRPLTELQRINLPQGKSLW